MNQLSNKESFYRKAQRAEKKKNEGELRDKIQSGLKKAYHEGTIAGAAMLIKHLSTLTAESQITLIKEMRGELDDTKESS